MLAASNGDLEPKWSPEEGPWRVKSCRKGQK